MKLGDYVTHPAGWAGVVSRIVVAPGLTVNEADWPDAVVLDLGIHAPGGRWASIGAPDCDDLQRASIN